MPMHNGERPMTDAQRHQIRRLCIAAEIPDKSGERYTEESAQALIEDFQGKAATVASSGRRDTGTTGKSHRNGLPPVTAMVAPET